MSPVVLLADRCPMCGDEVLPAWPGDEARRCPNCGAQIRVGSDETKEES